VASPMEAHAEAPACWSPTSWPVAGSTTHLMSAAEPEELTEFSYFTMPDWPRSRAFVSRLYSSRPCAAALVALSGLEESATAMAPRVRAPSVVFLSGGAQPRSCKVLLLFPSGKAGDGGSRLVAWVDDM